MLKFILCLLAPPLAVGLLSVVATAEPACDQKIKAVHANAIAAGPFRKVSVARFPDGSGGERMRHAIFDIILPDQFHLLTMDHRGKMNEMIIIGDQAWTTRKGRELAPMAEGRKYGKATAVMAMFFVDSIVGATCARSTDAEGRTLETFAWTVLTGDTAYVNHLTASGDTGLPLTFSVVETSGGKQVTRTDNTFYFNRGIKIEPPAP